MPQPPPARTVRGDPGLSRRQLLAIGALAVAVRVVYVLVARPTIPLLSDGQTYHLLGRELAQGRGYLAPFDWFFQHRSRPTAEFGPVHPAVLAVATRLGASTLRAQQIVLGLIGSVTPVLTAVLALRVTGRRAVAIGAGVAAALDPMLFGSDGALMAETVHTVLGLVALLALLAEGARWRVVAGIAIGLAVLTRGDGLLLVPFLALPLLLRRWRDLGIVVGIAALVVAPWLVRNAARFDGRLVLSNNVGSLVNGSNCPETYGGPSIGSWDFGCAYRVHLTGTDEAVSSARLRASGLRYLRQHAGRLPVVVPARVARAWGVLHPFGQARAEQADGRVFGTQAAGVVLDWLLVPLFVVGVVRLRRVGRSVRPLVGMVLLVTVLVALSYGSSRFRELAEPALIVGAAFSLDNVHLSALAEQR